MFEKAIKGVLGIFKLGFIIRVSYFAITSNRGQLGQT